MTTLTPSSSNALAHQTKMETENPFAKFLISGSVTIVFEAFCGGHYLEMLKILKQTSADPYVVITRRMIEHKGIVGVLDGFAPWGALQSIVKGSSFGFGQAFARRYLEYVPNDMMSDWQKQILSGGIGGWFQGIVMSPMLLMKTRTISDPRFRASGGFFRTSIDSIKLTSELLKHEGGLMSLTKGMGVFSFKRFCDWTTRYGFVVLVESFVKKYPEEKLSFSKQIGCSLFGGTLSALATVPIDVTVAMIQQAAKAGKKVSVREIYAESYRKGGISGIVGTGTRGLVPRVAHVALTVLMMKNVSSWCYTFIINRRRHQIDPDEEERA